MSTHSVCSGQVEHVMTYIMTVRQLSSFHQCDVHKSVTLHVRGSLNSCGSYTGQHVPAWLVHCAAGTGPACVRRESAAAGLSASLVRRLTGSLLLLQTNPPSRNECSIQCLQSFSVPQSTTSTLLCSAALYCSAAHNQKELRPLPAGLKPAVPTPEETAKRHGSSRAGSITGMVSSPRDLTGFPAGLQAPTFAREAMPGMYMQSMQDMGIQGRQFMQQRPGIAAMGQGYVPAGYMPAGYAGVPVGYRGMQAPPALDVSMQGQYGAVVGPQYMPQSPLTSPNTGLQTQGIGSPLMVPTAQASAAAGAAGQQFSPVGARGSQSSGGTSSAGGVWPQQQQAQAHAGRPAAATTPTAGGMQLPGVMLQQFQQLGVGGTAVAPRYDTAQAGMISSMQAPAAQYAQQPMMYMQQGADQGWVQQQMPLQQASQQQVQYGLQQYGAPGMEAQRSAQAPQQQMAASPVMGRMLPAQMPAQMSAQMAPAGLAPQQQVPAGAYAMQGDAQAALAQPWGTGPVGGVLDPSTALMQQPAAGQTTYETQTGW